MKLKIACFCAVLALFPAAVFAGPIIRSGESVSVDASQVLKGDFYGFGGSVTISGTGENDAYIAGGTVTVNAPIVEDLTVLGGAVQVHGDIGDDLRVVGGEVTLANSVKGDVVVLGGTLKILSTASIEGSLLYLGGELSVEGNVVGEIHGAADRVRINAEVGGDILLSAQSSFTLGDNARILGNLTHEGSDIVRAQNAEVTGQIRKMETPIDTGKGLMQVYALELAALLFASLALFFVARGRVRAVVEEAIANPGKSGLAGIGIFLVMPFIAGVLMVSVVGFIAGIALLALYVALILTAVAVAGAFIGAYLERALTKKSTITLSSILIGTLLFSVLIFIPVLGGLLMFAAIVVMLGALGLSFYRSIQP